MHDVGVDLNMNYAHDGSGTDAIYIPNMLRNKGYSSSDYVDFNPYKILDEIAESKPVCIRGQNIDTKNGHVWIIDGAISTFKNIQVTDYLTYDNSTRKITKIGQRVRNSGSLPVANTQYWHCNWGWDGKNNGFFKDFDTASSHNFDSDNNPSDHKYCATKMVYNIKH